MILTMSGDNLEKYRIVFRRFGSMRILLETPRFNEFMDALIKFMVQYKDRDIEHSSHYDELSDSLVNVVEFK